MCVAVLGVTLHKVGRVVQYQRWKGLMAWRRMVKGNRQNGNSNKGQAWGLETQLGLQSCTRRSREPTLKGKALMAGS